MNDVSVSRSHAVIGYTERGWFIVDAGSKNGTYVNGRKIEKASIREGDKVVVGDNLPLLWDGYRSQVSAERS